MQTSAVATYNHDSYLQPFIHDVQQLRVKAKNNIGRSSRLPALYNPVQQTIEILQTVLATEIACMLRYTMNAITAAEKASEHAKKEFVQNGRDEHDHIERVAERINQLGGTPDYNPQNLAMRAASDVVETGNLNEMIEENLIAERITCEHYRELIAFFADRDPTTRSMLEDLLEKEEEHVNDMRGLLPPPSLATIDGALA